ncbi:MAG: T9SS C-terminal target domain-containing protein [Calditrichaeota bacterium]|nr:MAG: T9SS C-terminal target domain-containing protein [Calditrichota bacterium]MBL1207592.1 T9SS C-terminal target domain-containing protein [Calditrichota bacterium]NOG47425.1 T9SS type A sorting domain-containing protein [Calditrichota bacterium]
MAFGTFTSTNSKRIQRVTIFLMLIMSTAVFAGTKTSAGTGNWNTAGTWTPSGVPGAGDEVVIANTHTVTLDLASTTVDSLTINSGGTLDLNANTLTVGTHVTINGDVTDGSGGATLNVGGNFTINSGAKFNDNANGISVDFNGSGTQTLSGTFGNPSLEFFNFTVSGTSTVDNNLSTNIILSGQFFQSSGTFQAGSSTITLGYSALNGYTFDKSGGTFTAETATLSIKASVNIRMRIEAATSFYAIEHAPPTGARTLSFDETQLAIGAVNYTITNGLFLQPNSNGVTFLNEAALAYSGTTTLSYTTNNSLTLGNEWPTASPPTNVTVNSSGTMTLGSTRTVGGTFTQTGDGTFDVTGGTFTVNGTFSKGAGTFSENGGTLAYGGSATLQYTSGETSGDEWPATVPNVTISSGTVTISGVAGRTVSNVLTVSSTLAAGGNTLTVGDGTGTDLSVTGSITSTASISTTSDASISSAGSVNTGGATFNCAGLTLDGTLTTGAGASTMTGAVDMGHNSTISTTSTATVEGSLSMSAGTATVGTSSAGELIMGGSGASAVSLSSGNIEVFNFTVNKTNGSEVTVTGNAGSQIRFNDNGTLRVQDGTLAFSEVGQIRDVAGTTTYSDNTLSLQIDAAGTLQTGGTDITQFNTYTTSSGAIVFNGSAQETLPTDITIGTVEVNNASGVITSTGTLTVGTQLTLTDGIITTTSTKSLRLASAATVSGTPDATQMVDGPLQKAFASGGVTFEFPIGYNPYLPATFEYLTNNVGTSILEIEAVQGDPGGTAPTNINAIATSHHYVVSEVGTGGSFTYNFTGTFTGTGFSPTSRNRLIVQNGSGPAYSYPNTIAQTVGGTTVKINDALSALPTNDGIIAFGSAGATITWDAGGGNDNWSTATNWDGDAVPQTGDAVVIGGTNTAIYDAGVTASSYQSITLSGAGATLTLTGGTLNLGTTAITIGSGDQLTFNGTTISGPFDNANTTYSSGSTVQYNTGTIQTDTYHHLTINNSTTLSSSGTVTVGGDFTKNGSGEYQSNGLLDVAGTTTLNAGTVTPGGGANLAGNISGAGGLFSGSTGTVTLDGSSQQTISGGTDVTFNNLTLSNTSGLSVQQSPVVEGTFTFGVDGLVTTTGSNNFIIGQSGSVSGASSARYVSGRLAKEYGGGAQSFTYATGKGGEYLPLTLDFASLTAGYVRMVEQINSSASGFDPDLDAGLALVSSVRYWEVSRVGATGGISGSIQMTLSYNANDGVDNSATELDVAQLQSGVWTSIGGDGSGTGTGTIQSTAFITAGDYYTLGDAAGGTDNSLPVELSTFEAEPELDKVTLLWVTKSETENYGFNVYKRLSEEDEWSKMNDEIIAGQGNTSSETRYEFVDYSVQSGDVYSYQLESVSFSGVVKVEEVVEIEVPIPDKFVLFNNYPNPFNPVTNLKFQLPQQSKVSLTVYDITGKVVKTILNSSVYDVGQHVVSWDGTNLNGTKVSSGMYVYRFSAGKYSKIGRMILVK